jgi:hypothetical protein
METGFTKTVQFTKIIKTGDKLREFNFTRFAGAIEDIFDVDVVDDRNNRILFKIRRETESWRIVPKNSTPLPEWIMNVEAQLHDILVEELKARRLSLRNF